MKSNGAISPFVRDKKLFSAQEAVRKMTTLAAANVGIAVSDETACLVPACDAVIRGEQLPKLPVFLAYARRARLDPSLPDLAKDLLEGIATVTGETATLSIPTPRGVEQIAQAEGAYLLGSTNWMGRCVPFHASAVGKTMLARRLGGILPPLTFEEALESTAIHSVAGALPSGAGLLRVRPFRAPHHTISNVALVGGGANPRPGEIALAHNGVLFLDEMPEFDRDVLEALRALAKGGATMLIATHEMAFAADVADRICYLEGGRIVEHGTPKQIFGAPRDPRTRAFLQRVRSVGAGALR